MKTMSWMESRGWVAVMALSITIGMGTCAVVHAEGGQKESSGLPKPLSGDEAVILSFEKEELMQITRESGIRENYIKKISEDRYDFPLATMHTTLCIRKGDATHGEWAFFFPITERGKDGTHRWTGRDGPGAGWKSGSYNPLTDWRGHGGAIGRGTGRDILNTNTEIMGEGRRWFAKLPGGKNWSGYHRVRMDVKCGAAAVLRLDIEDEEILPAVRRRFRIPADTWVTVELDLRKAVEARGLDLAKMCNFWVFLEETAAPATVLLDNIRLVKEGVKPSLPLVVDESSYAAEARVYAINPVASKDNPYGGWKILEYPEDVPAPAERRTKLPDDRGPWCVKALENMGKLGQLLVSGPRGKRWFPVAFDARRIIVSFYVYERDRHVAGTRVAVTEDGGKTWTGLEGGELPTFVFQGNRKSASGVSVMRDGIYVAGRAPYCSGHGYPGDRIFVQKISMTDDGWKAYPATPVGSDLRRCTIQRTVLKLASGRIWAAWPYAGRLSTEVATKYSDDGGRTWLSWKPGKCATFSNSKKDGGWQGIAVFLAPFGERVACVTSDQHTSVRIFNGATWNKPLRHRLGGLHSAVGLKGNRILLAYGRGKGVRCFDGTAFEKEDVAELDGDCCLSVCGDNVLLFAPKTRGGFKKLFCWRRSAAGEWTGPEEVVSEEKSITSFSAGPYSPETFTPLVWTCEGEPRVKVMLVPARDGEKNEETE